MGLTTATPGQGLHDLAGLVLGGHCGLNGGVAQQAIVQGLLGLGSFAAGGIHNQCNSIVQEQVEILEGTVLNAKSFEGGPVNLRGEILQQKPSGLVKATVAVD